MIAELLTGAAVVAVSAWAYKKYKKHSLHNSNREYMMRMAGVKEQKDKTPMLHEMKEQKPPEPYWWQKFENQKLIMSMGKLPETKEGMEAYLKGNAKKILYDEDEVEWGLSKEAKKQYKNKIEL